MNPFQVRPRISQSAHEDRRPDRARGAAQVAVAPSYQGRVMTSTTGGSDAPSFGWLGRAAIESGKRQPHMNVFGGEDRFWLGPEGGQYALYFKKGDPFDLDHWQVPDAFDWGAWEITSQSPDVGDISEADDARQLLRSIVRHRRRANGEAADRCGCRHGPRGGCPAAACRRLRLNRRTR